jgi:LacI family transcriptional regulator
MPLLQWFKSHQVDGIIWAAPEIEDNRFWLKDILPLIDIPIIFLTMEEQNNVSIVTTDNYNGAKAATEYFIQHGRKNIAHITGPLDWWESRQRKIGWETVLSETGVQVTDRMWSEGNWSSKSGKTAFLDLMNKYPEMDAILVGNDQMALGIFQSALEIGKKIPQEISVIGFDDIPESEFFTPSLSTVNPNQEELGKVAVTELITQIEQKLEEKIGNEPKYIMIQPELIIRKSS